MSFTFDLIGEVRGSTHSLQS